MDEEAPWAGEKVWWTGDQYQVCFHNATIIDEETGATGPEQVRPLPCTLYPDCVVLCRCGAGKAGGSAAAATGWCSRSSWKSPGPLVSAPSSTWSACSTG